MHSSEHSSKSGSGRHCSGEGHGFGEGRIAGDGDIDLVNEVELHSGADQASVEAAVEVLVLPSVFARLYQRNRSATLLRVEIRAEALLVGAALRLLIRRVGSAPRIEAVVEIVGHSLDGGNLAIIELLSIRIVLGELRRLLVRPVDIISLIFRVTVAIV